MSCDLPDSEILAQEQWAIELLARETNNTIANVQALFVTEYNKLAAGAHVKAYLPLLTGNLVRTILEDRNARRDAVSNVGTP